MCHSIPNVVLTICAVIGSSEWTDYWTKTTVSLFTTVIFTQSTPTSLSGRLYGWRLFVHSAINDGNSYSIYMQVWRPVQ